jgi:hypothetical protein
VEGNVTQHHHDTLSENPMDHLAAFEFELVALFLTLPLKNGWRWVKPARNLNLGVSRNRFCDFLADPDSRSFSRFGTFLSWGTTKFSLCLSRACLGLKCSF